MLHVYPELRRVRLDNRLILILIPFARFLSPLRTQRLRAQLSSELSQRRVFRSALLSNPLCIQSIDRQTFVF
jgi:hypothetical protein